MEIVPPEILKIAREFLGLSQADVEAHASVSRATIQRVEQGVRSLPQYAAFLQYFYQQCGIEFVPPSGDRGWGVFNNNTVDMPIRLNRLAETQPQDPTASPRKQPQEKSKD